MPQTRAAEVNYIVDHLLVTDNPRSTATAQVEALLRHHPPDKIREILYDESKINGLKLTDRRGSDIPIEPSVRTRLLALAPFIHHCQNLAGPSAMVSIHIPSLTRTSFERYIDQFDEANPTQYDASEARENYRTWMAIGRDSIPFQDPALYAQGSNNTTANNNNNNNNDGSGVAFSRTTRRDESDFYVDPYVSRGKGSWRFLSPFSVF